MVFLSYFRLQSVVDGEVDIRAMLRRCDQMSRI